MTRKRTDDANFDAKPSTANSQQLSPSLPSMPVPYAPAGLSKWLNPLGAVHGLLSDILMHRQYVKQMEVLQQQMAHQAKLMHRQIDAELEIALRTLEYQKNQTEHNLRAVYAESTNNSRFRLELNQEIAQLSAQIRSGNLNSEDRRDCLTALQMLSDHQKSLGEQNLQCLALAQQALETMANTRALASFYTP